MLTTVISDNYSLLWQPLMYSKRDEVRYLGVVGKRAQQPGIEKRGLDSAVPRNTGRG